MKQLTAISFLVIHLFNICGYKLFFSLAEKNADEKMIASLDKSNYNEMDLIQIKFALNAPYIQNYSDYERCDGKVEYNGVQYNYVKRIVQNDTLYLYCIPNKEKTDISKVKNLYANQTADNTSKKNDESTLKKISFQNEYNSGIAKFNFDTHTILLNQPIAFNNLTTLKGFTTKHLQPPDLFI